MPGIVLSAAPPSFCSRICHFRVWGLPFLRIPQSSQVAADFQERVVGQGEGEGSIEKNQAQKSKLRGLITQATGRLNPFCNPSTPGAQARPAAGARSPLIQGAASGSGTPVSPGLPWDQANQPTVHPSAPGAGVDRCLTKCWRPHIEIMMLLYAGEHTWGMCASSSRWSSSVMPCQAERFAGSGFPPW